MKLNCKVENFYNKHRSNIILASHTQVGLESILRDLFQEMYDLGHADGWAEAKPEDEFGYTKAEIKILTINY